MLCADIARVAADDAKVAKLINTESVQEVTTFLMVKVLLKLRSLFLGGFCDLYYEFEERGHAKNNL